MSEQLNHAPTLSSVREDLSQIFATLLGLESPSGDLNFFTSGGDSVILLMLLMSVEQRWQIYLDAADVYEGPTINTLSQRILTLVSGDR